MGFGFNLFVYPILVLIFIVVFIITFIVMIAGNKDVKRIFLIGWFMAFCGVLGIVLLAFIINFSTTKTTVDKSDVYGEYVIDTSKFPGKQADWQHEHFKFEIIEPNILNFDVLNDDKSLRKRFVRKIRFTNASSRSAIWAFENEDENTHHIIEEQPTLYRNTFSFYYVFHSKYYQNVFFKKKPLFD